MRWAAPVVVFATFLMLDFIWLGFIAKNFYIDRLSGIVRVKDGKIDIIYWAGILVYVLLTVGLCIFVLPGIAEGSTWWQAGLQGACFGVVLYGVYDFTNYSMLADWSLSLSAVDMLWGGFICAVATSLGFLVS